MNRIKTFIACSAVIISTCSIAQPNADTAADKTVFWQITGNGLSDTSYLFGTMHPLFREDVHIAKNMLTVLLNAKTVFFEHALYHTDDTAYIQMSTMDRPVLKRLIGGICFELLEEHLRKYDDTLLTSPALQWLDPAYMGARIIKNIFGQAVTSNDATILAIVLGNGQDIAYLDTPEMIQELKELIPADEQATMLYRFLRDMDHSLELYIQNVKAFTKLYYSGNIEAIYKRTGNFNSGYQLDERQENAINIADKLLDKRNKKWLPVMLESIQKQASFFAIGTAHLSGPSGLIRLLRRKGYTLTPLALEY